MQQFHHPCQRISYNKQESEIKFIKVYKREIIEFIKQSGRDTFHLYDFIILFVSIKDGDMFY